MTGRELILYILENHLENDLVFEDGKFMGFMTVLEAAEKFEVGTATISAWITTGRLPGIVVDKKVYVPCNARLKEVCDEA